MPSNVHLTAKNFKRLKPRAKGSHPSVKRVVKIKNKTYRATGVVKVPVEQYSKKKTGKSKDSTTILPGIDDEYTIDDLT